MILPGTKSATTANAAAPSLQASAAKSSRREVCRREDLAADACNDGAAAFAVVADFVPGRIIQERRPPRLTICERLPCKHVGELVAGFSDERCPETDGANAVLLPDGKRLVSKPGL